MGMSWMPQVTSRGILQYRNREWTFAMLDTAPNARQLTYRSVTAIMALRSGVGLPCITRTVVDHCLHGSLADCRVTGIETMFRRRLPAAVRRSLLSVALAVRRCLGPPSPCGCRPTSRHRSAHRLRRPSRRLSLSSRRTSPAGGSVQTICLVRPTPDNVKLVASQYVSSKRVSMASSSNVCAKSSSFAFFGPGIGGGP